MANEALSIVIVPATEEDIPSLVHIFIEAFSNDPVTQLKKQSHYTTSDPDGTAYVGGLIEAPLRSWLLNKQRYRVLKAVDTENTNTLGWICFGYHNVEIEATEQPEDNVKTSIKKKGSKIRSAEHEEELVHPNVSKKVDSESYSLHQNTKSSIATDIERKTMADLESLCSSDMKSWMSKLMPEDSQRMFVGSICVDPKFQRFKVGSSLIKYGTKRADEAHVKCWVHLSDHPGSIRAFERSGFNEVGRLELDLEQYRVNETQFPGKYVYRYMLRFPYSKEHG